MTTVNNNNRVFFACQAVEVSGVGFPGTAGRYLQGVQSVSMSSTADTEQVFQFGSVGIFENYNTRTTGDGEITIEKFIAAKANHSIGAMLCGDAVVSGTYGFMNGTATQSVPAGSTEYTYGFNNMASKKISLNVYILPEASGIVKSGTSAAGTKISFVDAIVSEYSVSAQIDGPATESVTFVSNNFGSSAAASTLADAQFNYDGNVVKRGNISGDFSDGDSVSYSVSIGNEDLFSLGQLDPYAKVPTFPASVTVEATRKAKSDFNSAAGGSNTTKSTTFGELSVGAAGLVLTNTSYGGGDAAGSNATITETYSSFNSFNVKWV